jgi:hypothetical protein
MQRRIYLIGSLRNPAVQNVGRALRDAGHETFDDWHAAGPDADQYWQEYETARGRSYTEALNGPVAAHNFEFDMDWLKWADTGVLVMPAGKSGHMELGYIIGRGGHGFVYMPDGEPDRWDLMYKLAEGIAYTEEGLVGLLG